MVGQNSQSSFSFLSFPLQNSFLISPSIYPSIDTRCFISSIFSHSCGCRILATAQPLPLFIIIHSTHLRIPIPVTSLSLLFAPNHLAPAFFHFSRLLLQPLLSCHQTILFSYPLLSLFLLSCSLCLSLPLSLKFNLPLSLKFNLEFLR